MLNEAVATERLQAFEAECDLLKYELDGWCIWPLLRFSVARAMQNIPKDRIVRNFGRQLLFSIMLFDLWGMLRLKKTDYVVKTDTSARAEFRNGLYEDIHYDSLLLALGPCYKIEGINNPDLFARGKKPSSKRILPRRLPIYWPDVYWKLKREGKFINWPYTAENPKP